MKYMYGVEVSVTIIKSYNYNKISNNSSIIYYKKADKYYDLSLGYNRAHNLSWQNIVNFLLPLAAKTFGEMAAAPRPIQLDKCPLVC